MTADDLRIDDWMVHRPNVVRSVAARVPGVDAEEATSRALEKMVRIVSDGGAIDQPAPYWRRAAVNEAISMTRAAGRTTAVEGATLAALVPPVDGAELDAERQADVAMLRSALSSLADADRTILVDRHVDNRSVNDIAGDLGVRPHAVTMRLRRAEERLAGAFAATHARDVDVPECRATRAGMHDYLKGRLLPRRQQRLEEHMDGCAACTRAFIDVREVSWMLRDLGQHVVAAALVTGAATGVAGVAGAGAGTTGLAKVIRLRSFGTKEAAVAAGVVAALVLGGGAAALMAGQPDVPQLETTVAAPGGGAGPARPEAPARPSGPRPDPTDVPEAPSAPVPDPAAERDRTAAPAPAPEREIEPAAVRRPAARAPETAPEPERAPEQAPERAPKPRPEPATVVDEPAASTQQPSKPRPESKPAPAPRPEPVPDPEPPVEETSGGPPGNPTNQHGKGPTKDNDQGPGTQHGKGHDKGHGKGHGWGNGRSTGLPIEVSVNLPTEVQDDEPGIESVQSTSTTVLE